MQQNDGDKSGARRGGRAERHLSFRLAAKNLKPALSSLIKRATKENVAVDKLKSLQQQAARLTDFMDSCQNKGQPFYQADAFPDLIRDLKLQLKDSFLSFENLPETQVASRLKSLHQGVLRFIDFVEEPYDSPFKEIKNFNELASSAFEESLKQPSLRNLHKRRDFRAEGAIKGSPEDLKKAVKELLANSLQALKPEEEKNKTIFIKTYNSAGFLILEVIDNGHGMTKEERKEAFDPLFSKRFSEGVRGLGLSLAEKIVKAHDGFIELESAGEGAVWEGQDLSTKPERVDGKNKGTLARIGLPLLPLKKQDSSRDSNRRLKSRSA